MWLRQTKEVESLNDVAEEDIGHYISNVNEISLKDQIRPVKIVNIVDGDTIDVITVIKMQKALKKYKDGSYVNVVIKVRCRLSGFDAAEKHDIRGPFATEFLKRLCENKPTKCYFKGKDKYGREIATLFVDNEDITNKVLEYNHPEYGPCFQRYDGVGRRKSFPKLRNTVCHEKFPSLKESSSFIRESSRIKKKKNEQRSN